jgi:uncharacterized phage-associated protein
MMDSVEFAKLIINRANFLNKSKKDKKEKITLGETKLHKLLYICDGFLLAADINFISEQAKAWNYGPVYPRVNTWLKKETDAFTKKYEDASEASREIKEIIPVVDVVIGRYGLWSANELSNWSHCPGSPWETALKKGKGVMNSVIDKKDMKKYFQDYLNGGR